jgi:hypothetical protein
VNAVVAEQQEVWPEPRTEDEFRAWGEFTAHYQSDPLGFVCTVFPWGVPGSPLENEEGPDVWQAVILDELGKQIRAGMQVIRIAVASGHGAGKSTLMAWITIWFQTCFPRNKSRVTAGTMPQLKSGTWREVAKWHELAANRWQFEWTQTKFICNWKPNTWYAEAMAWSEHNSQAFAGVHEEIVMFQFDEASTIADSIWDVSEGAFTTKGIFLAFGNPTEPEGRFAECFGSKSHRWTTLHVDSRDSRKANKEFLQQLIDDWGIDSDYVRVRVLGLFPIHGSLAFIPSGWISMAIARALVFDPLQIPRAIPLLWGVDVARQGEDQSVIVLRKGRYLLPTIYPYRIPDTMRLASMVAEKIREHRPDIVFIDGSGGYGAGVIDRLRQLGFPVVEVQFGAKADLPKKFVNKRAEIWSRCRDWIRDEAVLPNDPELRTALETPGYGYERKTERLKLESKDEIRKRGGQSPDYGDALAVTFAQAVPVKMQDEEVSLEPDVV